MSTNDRLPSLNLENQNKMFSLRTKMDPNPYSFVKKKNKIVN